MQTFLPYADFESSAAVLDRARLGKQRVETLQIMRSLNTGSGWQNHPAVRMWRGHELALWEYQIAVIREWTGRGYADTCLDKTRLHLREILEERNASEEEHLPPWMGDPAFHRAHQSNLVRKDPDHYREYFPDVPDNLEYIWPLNFSIDATN